MKLALADLHGRADLLEGVLRKVPDDATFVFLGDAVDRGPRNIDTIRLLSRLADEDRMVLLKGNHEQLMEQADATYDRFQREQTPLRRDDALTALRNWIDNGGDTVILEYGGWDSGGPPDAMGPWGLPPELLEYAARCGLEHRHRDLLCAHAAPPVKVKGFRRLEDSMLWARPEDGPFAVPDGVRLSLHGHTPIRAPTRRGQNVFLDLGAVWTGCLCAYDLDTDRVTVFRGPGTVPLENLPAIAPAGGEEPEALPYEVVEL